MAKNWRTIEEEIRRRIAAGELTPGARLPSGEEIAAEWGVSRHTAHHAIEELQRQGLVVRRRGAGTVVAGTPTGRPLAIALLVDGIAHGANHPSSDLLRGLHDGLGEEVNLIVADSKDDPNVEARHLQRLAGQADGIVAFPTGHAPAATAAAFGRLAAGGFPLVALDRTVPGVSVDAVVTDNEGATAHAVETLAARGHRRIAFLSFYKPSFSSVAERFAGYGRVVRALGTGDAEIERLTRWFPSQSDHVRPVFEQLVHDALSTLRQSPEPPTALFCVEDSVAHAALLACERLGSVPGRDLEIAAFSSWGPAALGRPWSVHRIVQAHYDIGRAAAARLLHRIEHPRAEPRTVRVPAHLILADAGLEPTSPSFSPRGE